MIPEVTASTDNTATRAGPGRGRRRLHRGIGGGSLLLALTVWIGLAPGVAQAQTPPTEGQAQGQATNAAALRRIVVVVAGLDTDARRVGLVEKLVLQNDGAEAYAPARWSESALRFGLPTDAQDVTVDSGPPNAALQQVGDDYVLAAPLPPGQQVLVVSYALPYQRPFSFLGLGTGGSGSGGTLRVSRSLATPADDVQVLVPNDVGINLRPTVGLASSAPVTLGSQTYAVVGARGVRAGTLLVFELQLPAALPSRATRAPARTSGAIPETALLVTLAALLGTALLYGAWRAPQIMASARPVPRASRTPGSGVRGQRAGFAVARRVQAGQAALAHLASQHVRSELTDVAFETIRLRAKAQLLVLIPESLLRGEPRGAPGQATRSEGAPATLVEAPSL